MNPPRRKDFRLGKYLVFLVDDEVLSAPAIMRPLNQRHGSVARSVTTLDQAEEVAAAIRGT